MTIADSYLVNRNADLHLRDARHAHQLYTQHNFALAPKVKFLYHVVFEFSAAVEKIPNSKQFQKELGVLANTVALPTYRVDLNTKQQYNRKKNVQTRINYDEVSITFHDDNTGVTRALLEEYYRFYFRDGGKHENGVPFDFGPRDKYAKRVPRYGMDNDLDGPFFNFIRIYQLSRQKWVSYTLVNPLITSWGHDDLDYADGTGIMENKISVAYEAVMYDSGDINPNADPAGFTSPETRYDVVDSPLELGNGYNGVDRGAGRGVEPVLIKQNGDRPKNIFDIWMRNKSDIQRDPLGTITKILTNSRNPTIGGLQQLVFPKADTQATSSLSNLLDRSVRNLNPDAVRSGLTNDRSALTSTVKRALATGAFSSEWNSSNFSNYDNLSSRERQAIENEVIDRAAGGDKKLQQIASQALSTRRS